MRQDPPDANPMWSTIRIIPSYKHPHTPADHWCGKHPARQAERDDIARLAKATREFLAGLELDRMRSEFFGTGHIHVEPNHAEDAAKAKAAEDVLDHMTGSTTIESKPTPEHYCTQEDLERVRKWNGLDPKTGKRP